MSDTIVIERRVSIRLLAYWEKLRRSRNMPSKEDINAEDLHDLWDSCFLVYINYPEPGDYHYAHLGKNVKHAYRSDSSQQHLNDSCGQVVSARKPLIHDGEFKNALGELVRYRQCVLPLGTGNEVEAVFGAMRFKTYS